MIVEQTRRLVRLRVILASTFPGLEHAESEPLGGMSGRRLEVATGG